MKEIPFNLGILLKRNATLHETSEAMVTEDERYSYRDVYLKSLQAATNLSTKGVKNKDRLAVLSEGSPYFLFTVFASCHLGAIVVPINTRLSEGEILNILKDTKPSLLIASGNYLEKAKKLASRFKGLPVQDIQGLYTTGVSRIMPDISDILPHSPCMIIHTAAVGGKPRGAILTQANLIATALQIVHLLELTEEDRHLCLLPLFHIGGLAFSLATFLIGGKTVITPGFEPDKIPSLIVREGVTFFVTFPPMLAAILEAEKREGFPLSSLRLVGGVDSAETIEQFLSTHTGAVFYQLYGQTECMPISGGIYRGEAKSIGRPAILTHVSIRDEEERELPPGVCGEICVRSPAVFQGYWRLSGETAYTFREGWHHTGDLGEFLPDGTLLYRGRKPEKDLIKTGGENVYPREVEKVLLTHEAIREACVIGVPHEKWGEAVVALCTLKEGRKVGEREVIEHVSERIARYKRPQRVLFLDEMPKKADGSIDRERAQKMGVEFLSPPPKRG